MDRAAAAASPLRVACLCAAWCRVCDDWRPAFDQLAAARPELDWIWVDVEDQADALGGFEPDNFPTLAVQRGADLLYCAALPPHAGSWGRLIDALRGADAPSTDLPPGPRPDLNRLHDQR